MTDTNTTHFGFKQVPVKDKADHVAQVFDSVVNHYDLMNDLMSLSIHRLWKRFTVATSNVRPGSIVLDLAGGTGDLAIKFSQLVGPSGRVVLADINASMLSNGRDRLLDLGVSNIDYVQADAEALPFPSNYFDKISIALGLRNVTDKEAALRSMYRVLKPGGQLMILEFSQPSQLIKPMYDFYSFKLLPKIGKVVLNDEQSYQYLAESIRMHPDQDTLRQMMESNGFEGCDYHNMTGGIVALHRGYKF